MKHHTFWLIALFITLTISCLSMGYMQGYMNGFEAGESHTLEQF